MNEPIFQLENVCFSYDQDWLSLKNISLDILPDQRLVILGVNGSGKSTLLKLLNGLIFANSGQFKAFGHRVNEELLENGEFATFFRSQVAMVFQDSDIQLFSPTVLEDLMFGPLQLGLSKEQAASRVSDLLKMFSIDKLKNCSPNNLSGGEKKKVAIATSLSTNPDVIMLDEPTNNLDPRTRVWLYQLIDRLANIGKTIILSTQDLELAKVFAQRIVVMDEEHKIVAVDSAEKILADKDLLLEVNLIHEHVHNHSGKDHIHPHYRTKEHKHDEKEVELVK
ncbi:hypothetical protein LCGC14_1786580 [marine sediment metagenome]|uniref:ABC transporter domain-containing protein n=1 Tax=marine sediment metagenome TaxID=412755 RepID=A0A0F9J8R1_9ZZZZ|nr:ABC transporter ATP-binding protein [Actinomycetota bacterium]